MYKVAAIAITIALLSPPVTIAEGLVLLALPAETVQRTPLFDEDVTFYAPSTTFSQGEAQNTVIDSKGALTLAPGATSGSFVSPQIPIQQFNGLMFSMNGDCPEAAVLGVLIRVIMQGVAGTWRPLSPEDEFLLTNGAAQQFQYMVNMQRNGLNTQSPTLTNIGLATENYNQNFMNQQGLPATTNYSGSVAKPRVVPRSGWGARPARSSSSNIRPQRVVVHHTAGSKGGASTVKAIQGYHQRDRGWSDIGYHYLVSHDGTVFEGRPENARGAHVAGANSTSLGISVMGHYSKYQLDAPGWNSLVQMTAYMCAKYKISPSNIVGHQDMAQKDCPGRYIYSRMDELRRAVASLLQQGARI